ncbi:hypothetical protein Tco_1174173 [Tanacetum coccineum]
MKRSRKEKKERNEQMQRFPEKEEFKEEFVRRNHEEIISGFKKECFIDFGVMEVKPDQETSTGTDIAKIARERSKPDKHGHGNGKECTRAGRMLSKINKI